MRFEVVSKISIAGVLVALAACIVFGQAERSSAGWRDYRHPQDGFAISFPYAPTPHADNANPGMTVYTIRLNPKSAISIRSKPAPNCGPELREAVKTMAGRLGWAMPKSISVEGSERFEGLRMNAKFLVTGPIPDFGVAPRWPSPPASVGLWTKSDRLPPCAS